MRFLHGLTYLCSRLQRAPLHQSNCVRTLVPWMSVAAASYFPWKVHFPAHHQTSTHMVCLQLRLYHGINDWEWILERVVGVEFKELVFYQWQWCGCHQSQNHWGRRSGSPEPATVAIWPPNLSWLVGGLEFPFLSSPWKSVQFSQLV